MPLGTLTSRGDVYRFVLENIDPRAFSSDRWTFLHIPKTAGSSLREELADVLQPDYNIEVDYQAVAREHSNQSFERKMVDSLSAFDSNNNALKVKLISGHFRFRHIKDLKTFDGSRLISMVRNPLERLKSDYTYQISAEHPLHKEVLRRYPNFRDFFSDPINRDVMFFHLCDNEGQSNQELLDFLFQRYTFIGTQEMYSFSIKVIFMLLGMRVEPRLRLRARNDADRFNVNVNVEEQRLVREYNARDYFLWEKLSEIYRPVVPKFFQYSDFDRFFKIANGLPHAPF